MVVIDDVMLTSLVGGEYTYTFDWDLVVKNGKEYAKIVTSKVGYTTRRDYYDFGNLFNGDKLLGKFVCNTLLHPLKYIIYIILFLF